MKLILLHVLLVQFEYAYELVTVEDKDENKLNVVDVCSDAKKDNFDFITRDGILEKFK